MLKRKCLTCGDEFVTNHTRRIYCSTKCRLRDFRENKLTCYYCGDLATSRDHIFPQKYGDGKGDFVNACTECNVTLQAIAPESHYNRIKILAERLTKKYQLETFIPKWSESELEEMGYSLRTAIQHHMTKRDRARERVIHIEMVARQVAKATISTIPEIDLSQLFPQKKDN